MNRADYDDWSKNGLETWGYAHCLPYFKRSENYALGDPKYRGLGPVTVTKTKITNPFSIVSECIVGIGNISNPDHNGARQGGAHEIQRNVCDGIRTAPHRPICMTHLRKAISSTAGNAL